LRPFPVDVTGYDVLTAGAAGHQVVDRGRVLKAYASWHQFDKTTLADGWHDET
jgi:hypothetical protein